MSCLHVRYIAEHMSWPLLRAHSLWNHCWSFRYSRNSRPLWNLQVQSSANNSLPLVAIMKELYPTFHLHIISFHDSR